MTAALSLPPALVVDVDVRIVSPNRLVSEHWRSRHWRRRRERKAVALALQRTIPPPGPRWRVTLTRLSAATCDDDNLAGAFKAPRDEVAAYLGVSDARRGPVTWVYEQERLREVEPAHREGDKLVPRRFKVRCRIRIETASE